MCAKSKNNTVINSSDKKQEYRKIVEKVLSRKTDDNGAILTYDKKTKKHIVIKNSKGTFMKTCPFNEEINLWNYWQGHGHFNPKIMVFGQDWGSVYIDDEKFVPNLETRITIAKNSTDGKCHYFDGENINSLGHSTNRNMATIIGAALGYTDILKNDCPDLYFTNVCLAYRSLGSSGNFIKKWITELEKEVNPALIRLLSPNVIVCLGFDAYESLLLSLGEKDERNLKPEKSITKDGETIKPFNVFIEENNKNPYVLTNYNDIPVFVFAHCGPNGTLNRNGGKNASLDIQIADWKNLNRYI